MCVFLNKKSYFLLNMNAFAYIGLWILALFICYVIYKVLIEPDDMNIKIKAGSIFAICVILSILAVKGFDLLKSQAVQTDTEDEANKPE